MEVSATTARGPATCLTAALHHLVIATPNPTAFAEFHRVALRYDITDKDWNQIRDWCDHMARNHIPVQWRPGRHGPGNNLFMFVHDTDGNWVEISSELEVVSDERPVGRWPHEKRTLNSWGRGLLRS